MGWDTDRGDWRTFRVDRATDVRSLRGSFAPRDLPARDAATIVRERIEGSAPTYEAPAAVDDPAAEVRRRLPSGAAEIEEIDARTTRVRLAEDTRDWLLCKLLRHDANIFVAEPPDLQRAAMLLGERLRSAASGPFRR